jgi:hypothetical protein
MSIFNELEPIFLYLNQVRKLEAYICFDMVFPNTWKIPKRYIIEDKFLNQGAVDDKTIALSFISEFNEKSINTTQNNIMGIISYNLEREEKERLLNLKISELKNIFDKQSLDSLKELKFNFDKNNLITEDGKKSETSELVSPIIEDGQD